jgi:hypothetical protein
MGLASPKTATGDTTMGKSKNGAAKATKAVTKKSAATKAKKVDAVVEAPPAAAKPMTGLDAAAFVLKESGEPMRCKVMVEQMLQRKLWTTGGKTPSATIYAAILREVATKGEKARFKKTGKGTFALAT